MILNIEDVNDNPPVFVHNKYEARLLENQLDFDSPLIVEARDVDLNGISTAIIVELFVLTGQDNWNYVQDKTIM